MRLNNRLVHVFNPFLEIAEKPGLLALYVRSCNRASKDIILSYTLDWQDKKRPQECEDCCEQVEAGVAHVHIRSKEADREGAQRGRDELRETQRDADHSHI